MDDIETRETSDVDKVVITVALTDSEYSILQNIQRRFGIDRSMVVKWALSNLADWFEMRAQTNVRDISEED